MMKKVSIELDWLDAKTLSSLLLHHLVTSGTQNEEESRVVERVRAAIACAHPVANEAGSHDG